LALQCLADRKRAGVEIDRVPREAERLALAVVTTDVVDGRRGGLIT
jgi:hypothetical protein